MPTYEYKCPNCGQFEVEQRITEDGLTRCPKCAAAVKKLMPRRLFIQFKGPGFHVNDYSSKGAKSSPTPAPSHESDSSGSTDASTDASTGASKGASKGAAAQVESKPAVSEA